MQKKSNSQIPPHASCFSYEFEQIWNDIAIGLSLLGKYEPSISAYKSALSHNPANTEALYGISKLYISLNNQQSCFEMLERLRKIPGEEYRCLVLEGHISLKKNEIESAFESFKKASLTVKNNDYDSFFLYGLGLFFELIDISDLAGKIFLRHYNKYNFYEKNVDLLYRLGVIYKNGDRQDFAMRIFNVLLRMNDLGVLSKNDISIQIAHLYEKKNEHAVAVKMIQEMFLDSPNYIYGQRLYAWILFKTSDHKKGIEYLTNLVNTLNDPYLFYILGRMHYEEIEIEESFNMYRKAIRKEKGNPWFWNSIGILYLRTGQFEQAKGMFVQALNLEGEFQEAVYNLSLLLALDGSSEEEKQRCKDLYACDVSLVKEPEKEDPREVVPDLGTSSYFKTHLFFGGSTIKYDKSKIKDYILPIEDVVLKKMDEIS